MKKTLHINIVRKLFFSSFQDVNCGKQDGKRNARPGLFRLHSPLAARQTQVFASGSYRKNEQYSQLTRSPFPASMAVCGEFFMLQFEQLPS